MAKKKKETPKVDQATAVIMFPCRTPEEMVSCGHQHYAAMKSSPLWATLPVDVQQAGIDLETASSNVEANDTLIASLLAQLATARGNTPILGRRWRGKKSAVLTKVTDHSDGSKDTVTGLGFGVFATAPLPPSGVPQNLRDKHSKVNGEAHAVWDRPAAPRDHMVQHASDPANPATVVGPVVVSKAFFKLAGQTPGALVYVRVLTIDPKLPTGQSDYTAWVPVMVGA